VGQINESNPNRNYIEINNKNFLKKHKLPKVDLIISSPPYVTSYEYADLHQLSILWLGYADDYRYMRRGSIGSIYNSENFRLELDELNAVGRSIVKNLLNSRRATAKVRSVARYYLDIQKAICKCSTMLNNNGMAFFVVGDTENKGVKIRNSEHLIQCLIDEGFTDIKAAKRRISNKLLTPYRDSIGRFSSDKSQRTIYHEEFIISGRM
jgi:DNA modification methylase